MENVENKCNGVIVALVENQKIARYEIFEIDNKEFKSEDFRTYFDNFIKVAALSEDDFYDYVQIGKVIFANNEFSRDAKINHFKAYIQGKQIGIRQTSGGAPKR